MNLEKHLPPGQGTIAILLYVEAQWGANFRDTRGMCVRDRRSVYRKARLEAFRAKGFTAQQCQQLRNIPGAAARRTRGSDTFCREVFGLTLQRKRGVLGRMETRDPTLFTHSAGG